MRRIVLVHVRHVVYRDASGLTARACTGHGRFGARRTRNKAADAAESVDADLQDHVRVLWGSVVSEATAVSDPTTMLQSIMREGKCGHSANCCAVFGDHVMCDH